MDLNTLQSSPFSAADFRLAPIHDCNDNVPLRLCVLVRSEPDAALGSFLLLREYPGSRVYLGAVCDAGARIQEWVEVCLQTLEMRDLAFSGYHERLTNHTFDHRWRAEYQLSLANEPETVITTGMELRNPAPVLIKVPGGPAATPFLATEAAPWQLCQDDALLGSLGLPPYSTSPFRYLHQPAATGAKTFLATSPDAPINAHVQSLDRLKTGSEPTVVFNPHGGLIRVIRTSPLALEDYLQVLEGRAWEGLGPGVARWLQPGVYADLQAWSGSPKGMPFLLHGSRTPEGRLNEIFFLKLSAILNMLKEVRACVKAHQLPLLNLSPASFQVRLQEVGDQFPALWSAKCVLVKPSQAHPLDIKSTEQKYFVRLGKVEPSPFLPEGLGAHSFGIGSVRRRNVVAEADGVVIEGTLVAEDYLGLDPQDLLWFKLPLGDVRLEFYAHVYSEEAVGPKEARFRTVPMTLPDPVVATLKQTVSFAKAPYEIWPLLSSPCDLHSLGIIAIRVLLANSQSNLPTIADDVLGLARHLGENPEPQEPFGAKLGALLKRDAKLYDLVSPHLLSGSGLTPQQARSSIHLPLWLEAIAWLLRLFPGAGAHSYCKNFGDVPPLALETVFDGPVQELESLVCRLRSLLVPTNADNEEIARILLEQIAAA